MLGAQKVERGQNEVKRIGGCKAVESKWLLAIRGTKGIDVGGTVVLLSSSFKPSRPGNTRQ